MRKGITLDLSHLTKDHEHKWVALSSETAEVLASGDDLASVRAQLQNQKLAGTPVFHRVLPRDVSFAPQEV